MALNDNVIRILIHTDTHLGFMERDTNRGDDSLASFEEALYTAKKEHADLIIHAGDMFHENKPSRRTMHNTIGILRKYCYGDNSVYMSILNNSNEVPVVSSSFGDKKNGEVNFENPHQAISLPYFAIHGNHDDPSREGTGGSALSAMDLLSVSGCVNYFGKSDKVDEISVKPILLKKKDTYIALYGLGAIRDERLNRMWRDGKVTFCRPDDDVLDSDVSSTEEKKKYFNIFVVHQNRDYGRGSKNCISESMLPSWMDVIIWGNEHEHKPGLYESLIGHFRIYQPGSSIATSYAKTESHSNPKHMGLLQIRCNPSSSGSQFKLTERAYTQVRPFLYDEVVLKEQEVLDPKDPRIEEKMKDFLRDKIGNMIQDARSSYKESVANGPDGMFVGSQHSSQGEDILKYRVKNPDLVLVRLRIDYEGFVSLNQTRFGQLFVGQVANPSDMLLFAKNKASSGAKKNSGAVNFGDGQDETEGNFAEFQETESQKKDVNSIKIEHFVDRYLSQSKKINLLPQTVMENAIERFIDKKIPKAIEDCYEEVLKQTQKKLLSDNSLMVNSKEDIVEKTSRIMQQYDDAERSKSGIGSRKSKVPEDFDFGFPETSKKTDSDSDSGGEISKTSGTGRGRGRGRGRGTAASARSTKAKAASKKESPPPTGRASKRSSAKARKTYADEDNSENSDLGESVHSEAEIEDFSSEDEEFASKPKKRKTSPAPKKKVAAGKRKAITEEIDDEEDESLISAPSQSQAPANSRRKLPGSAATGSSRRSQAWD